MAAPESNLDLFRIVRAVQRSSTEGDVDALHAELCRLRNALVERRARCATPDCRDVTARVCRHGRERLLHFVDELLSTADERTGSCTCLVRAAELRSMVVRYVRIESRCPRRAHRPPPA